jgi:hypothetical protein
MGTSGAWTASQHPRGINAIIYQRRKESMFTKASLVLTGALLVGILVNHRSQGVVQAQASIEYRAVLTKSK